MVRLHPLYYFDTHFCYVVVVVVVLAPTLFLFQTLLGRWRQDEHVPFPSLDSFHAFVLLVRSPEDHHAIFASVRIVVVVVVSRDTFRLRRRDDGVQRRRSKDDAEHDAPDEKPGDFVRGWQSERRHKSRQSLSSSSSPPPSSDSMHAIIARTHWRTTTGGGGGVAHHHLLLRSATRRHHARRVRQQQQQQRHEKTRARTGTRCAFVMPKAARRILFPIRLQNNFLSYEFRVWEKRRRKFKISFSGKKVHFKKGSEREREREIESRLFHRRSDSSTDTTTAFFPLRAQIF